MENKKQLTIDISVRTILKIVLVILILSFFYLIRNVIVTAIIAFVFASLMIPLVDYLKKKKIPRIISTIGIYLIFLYMIALAIYLVIPIVVSQMGNIINNVVNYLKEIAGFLGNKFGFHSGDAVVYLQDIFKSFSGWISSITDNIYNLTIKFIGALAAIILVLVLAFYLTIEEDAIKKVVSFFTPSDKQKQLTDLINKAQTRMGLWLGGQLLMSFAIFIISFIVFLILKLENAFTLALIMGLLEIIPYFGPLIGGTAAALVGFSHSFWLGIIVIIIIILIQQLENHILEPNIMGKVTGLSPVVIIIAILVGVEIFGFVGLIIAIPIAVGISVILKESEKMHKKIADYKNRVKVK